jgi:signal peptidase I
LALVSGTVGDRTLHHGLARLSADGGRLVAGRPPYVRVMKRRLRTYGAAAAVLAASLTYSVAKIDYMTVVSASMEPSLHCAFAPGCTSLHADQLVVLRPTFISRGVRRGDIVVVTGSATRGRCSGTAIVKRIVALPGDTVAVSTSEIRVYSLGGRSMFQVRLAAPPGHQARTDHRLRVPRRSVFLLGDNPGHSCDSRVFGPVSTSAIIGRVVLIHGSGASLRLPHSAPR